MFQKNDGKLEEKLVREWLEERNQHKQRFAYHRFPDARAARGAMQAQPSDMLVISEGITTFLEIKSTEQKTRLPRSKVSQYGMLKKMSFAGAEVAVLVHRLAFNDWIVFENLDLDFLADDTPTSFPFEGRRTFPTHAAALTYLFG